MPNQIKDIETIDATSYPYIYQKNVSILLKNAGVLRFNIYRPKGSDRGQRFPVLVTYGPYGKDIPYESFNPGSYKDVNPDHKTDHSAWEVPTPSYWTAHGYVVIRADEIGTGQSPGKLDAFSSATIDSFCELVEWAAEQVWSTGKVGLLGISYYAATQWQVAARNPKGLAAIVPWEGFSDYYRDALRPGGILSNGGMDWIWNRQIGSNQYGLPDRAARNWGDDTIEGDLPDDELTECRTTILHGGQNSRYRDSIRFASVNFNLEDIRVPLLSVANWGGILLHLRGNVHGYMNAGSEFKYLRFIVGRHDTPFFYSEEVEVQRSFLDAFLADDDRMGWSRKGAVPSVDLVLRKGNMGYNNAAAESQFVRRKENEWPIARTEYRNMYLYPDESLRWGSPTRGDIPCKVSYKAHDTSSPEFVTFISASFGSEMEITGHIVVHLNVSVSPDAYGSTPSEIDLFLSLRHISEAGDEIFYTGTQGDPAPLTKGFLRVSLRQTDSSHPRHRPYLPYRHYQSRDVLPVLPNEVYCVEVEIWPTNVVIQKGEKLALDIGSKDLPGTGIFTHDDPDDR